MGYTHLIWDFNGTIYDDLEACLQAADKLLAAHGLPPLTGVEQYRSYFGFPIEDYYRRMGFDFSVTPYHELAVEWVDYYLRFCKTSGLCKGVLKTLKRVSKLNLPQLILSATSKEMLLPQLESLGIASYFEELLALDNIHAVGKIELARAWRAEHPNALPLLIGDTDHDAEAAKAMNADCVLIASGHQSKERLEQTGHRVLDSLEELPELLK